MAARKTKLKIAANTNSTEPKTGFPTTFYTAAGSSNFAAPFAHEIPLLEGRLETMQRENIRHLAASRQAGANISCAFIFIAARKR